MQILDDNMQIFRFSAVYLRFEGGVGGVVGAFDGQGSYGDIAVDGGVAVNLVIVVIAVDAMSHLSPRAVAEVDKVVGEVGAALTGDQYILGIFGNIDVEDIAVRKNVVFGGEIADSVKPLLGIIKVCHVSGEREGFETSGASLEYCAVGCRVHYVLTEVETFVYAGNNEVVAFVQAERCKAHAVGRGTIHAICAHSVHIIDFLHFEGIVYVNGVTFAALLYFWSADGHFAEFFCPVCYYAQTF